MEKLYLDKCNDTPCVLCENKVKKGFLITTDLYNYHGISSRFICKGCEEDLKYNSEVTVNDSQNR